MKEMNSINSTITKDALRELSLPNKFSDQNSWDQDQDFQILVLVMNDWSSITTINNIIIQTYLHLQALPIKEINIT